MASVPDTCDLFVVRQHCQAFFFSTMRAQRLGGFYPHSDVPEKVTTELQRVEKTIDDSSVFDPVGAG